MKAILILSVTASLWLIAAMVEAYSCTTICYPPTYPDGPEQCFTTCG